MAVLYLKICRYKRYKGEMTSLWHMIKDYQLHSHSVSSACLKFYKIRSATPGKGAQQCSANKLNEMFPGTILRMTVVARKQILGLISSYKLHFVFG